MADFDAIADIVIEISEDSAGEPALLSISSERGAVAQRLHGQVMMGSTQISNATSQNCALRARLPAGPMAQHRFGANVYVVRCKRLTGAYVHADVLTALGYTLGARLTVASVGNISSAS